MNSFVVPIIREKVWVETVVAGLTRVRDKLFKCEQNLKMPAKIVDKIILLKFFRVANASNVFLTRESIRVDTKIGGLTRIQTAIYNLCKFQNDEQDGGQDRDHTNFL